MTELVVQSAGPATSLQDAGRFGWQRFGVGPAGAMDRLSLALANVSGRQPARTCGHRVRAGRRAAAGFRRQRPRRAGRRGQRVEDRRSAGCVADQRHRARRPDDRVGSRPLWHLLLSRRGRRICHRAGAGLGVAAPSRRHRRSGGPDIACRRPPAAGRYRNPPGPSLPSRSLHVPRTGRSAWCSVRRTITSRPPASPRCSAANMRSPIRPTAWACAWPGRRSSTAPRASTSYPTAFPRAACRCPATASP